MGQSHELVNPERFVLNPTEDLDAEYKGWLNLRVERDRATLAKAVIALANHGGGVIVLGFEDLPTGLVARPKPSEIPDVTQDDINAAVSRYATPQFHCRLHLVENVDVSSIHPVIRVPGGDVPVLSKRDESDAGLGQHKAYIRKPGPKSEEPQTADEWRKLLDRCVMSRREEMLDSIRGIVLGRVEPSRSEHTSVELEDFMSSSREHWLALKQSEPEDAPYCFPDGYYEIAISLVGAQPPIGLTELKDRLAVAQGVQESGWPPFMEIGVGELNPYPSEGGIDAWIGRPSSNRVFNDPSHADFWRASPSGQLYIIRGYWEDGVEWGSAPQPISGTVITVNISVIRVWECLRFASRFMRAYGDVEEVVVRCQYTGLSGRRLVDSLEPAFSIRRGVSRVDEVTLTGQFTLQQLEDNMPEVLRHLMAPLFEHFEFFRLTVAHVQNVIDRYRERWPS